MVGGEAWSSGETWDLTSRVPTSAVPTRLTESSFLGPALRGQVCAGASFLHQGLKQKPTLLALGGPARLCLAQSEWGLRGLAWDLTLAPKKPLLQGRLSSEAPRPAPSLAFSSLHWWRPPQS